MARSKRTRNALIQVQSYEVGCPHCGEPVVQPDTGSLLWTTNQAGAGAIHRCPGCNEQFKIPKQGPVAEDMAILMQRRRL